MQSVDTYPFERPRAATRSIKTKSELIMGRPPEGCCTLHKRKMGMNRVRRIEKASARFADHVIILGKEQMYRPKKSPRLNVKK
jgi:hypothetical protein